jgi:hypothetical protein
MVSGAALVIVLSSTGVLYLQDCLFDDANSHAVRVEFDRKYGDANDRVIVQRLLSCCFTSDVIAASSASD